MFVVTGATGNVGRALVQRLLDLQVPVRAVVRDPATAALPDGVEVVAGDLSAAETLAAAFAHAETIFLLPGYPGVADAAKAAGVGRIVLLSGGSAGSADLSNAVTRYMRESETDARATGLEWTFLRPAAFMSNALRWLPQLQRGDTVRLPFPDVPIAMVDPGDVASVAAVAMTEDGHHAMIYRPTGPQALLPVEQVAILGAALGRSLRFEAQPNAEARRDMLTTTPPEYVAAFFDFYVNRSLDESTVRPTVADVTARPPHTFADWTTANAHRFS